MIRAYLSVPYSLALAAACMLVMPGPARAQPRDANDDRAGSALSGDSLAAGFIELAIEPAAVLTLPLGTLESIHGSVPCSRQLAGSSSVNAGAGVGIGYVLPKGAASGIRFRSIRLAAGYEGMSSLFESSPDESYESYDPVNGVYRTISTRLTAAYTLAYIRAAAEAELAIGDRFMVRLGPSLALPIAGSVRESEAILAPENAVFPERTQERQISEGTGDINDLGMRLGLGAAIAYRLPLGTKLYVEPTIGVDLGLTAIQPRWSPLLVRGGIAVGYMFLPSPYTAPPPPVAVVEKPERDIVPPSQPPLPTPAPFAAEPTIDVAAAKLPIEFRRQIVTRYVPVLPTLFFDQNAPMLPERYIRLAHGESARRGGDTGSFDELALSSNAEQAHYQSLNIFARRLRRYPAARLTITGTTSRDEDNRASLAGARAQGVADYLVNVWGIDRNRIILRTRTDPTVPSSSESPQGREENRRVELDFDDDEIYRPLQLRSVEPITEPASIPFTVGATSSEPIARWKAEIVAGGNPMKTMNDAGAPEGEISWDLTNADRERVLSSGSVAYRLTVFDSTGRSASSPTRQLPVRLDTTISVRTSADRPDNKAEFLLVTFDFDRADLTRRGRLELEAILDRIGPASSVSIIGYTDQVGEAEHNKSLAIDRARKVASLMPSRAHVEYRGASPEEAPYSSTAPEGRFLSRTVRVVVTDPR